MQRIDMEERMMERRCTTFLTGIMLLLVGHLVLAGNLTINDRAALGDL
jgi:hypothetical protein